MANFVGSIRRERLVEEVRRESTNPSKQAAEIRTAEWWGGRKQGFFERIEARRFAHADGSTCGRCSTGRENQYLCRLCAGGGIVQQVSNFEGNVCLRHGLWVAPWTIGTGQQRVGHHVLVAERTVQRLIRKGRIDAYRYAELRALFARWAQGLSEEWMPESELYVPIARVWDVVSNPEFQHRLLDPRKTFAEAYSLLESAVEPLVSDHPAPVVDGLWLMLRPNFLVIRERFEGAAPQGQFDPHDLPVPTFTAPVQRPLEPFGRYLEQLRTCSVDPWTDLNLRLHHSSPRRRTHDALTVGDDTVARYICANGHRSSITPNTMAGALRDGRMGCVYCANLKALAGYNSIVETNPPLALQWHPTRNGSVLPSEVLAGGSAQKYWWVCVAGHEFEETPNNRSRGKGCPFCSRRRVLSGVSDLGTTHPCVAATWHPTRNGRMVPSMVLSGSGRDYWWLCSDGHEYESSPSERVNGRGCPICANLQIVIGLNDLATTHPHVAIQWHPTMNGDVTPQHVVAGSGRVKYWWLCDKGHAYDATICGRVAGKGCRFCANQDPLVGFNTLADIDPARAKQWHPTRNGALTPQDVVAGSGLKAWWLCDHGHDFEQTVVKRRAGQDCPYCGNRKLWVGFNDVAARYPLLIPDWDSDENGCEPSAVMPGAGTRCWACAYGHRQQQTVRNRSLSGGCTQCPRDQRAGVRAA